MLFWRNMISFRRDKVFRTREKFGHHTSRTLWRSDTRDKDQAHMRVLVELGYEPLLGREPNPLQPIGNFVHRQVGSGPLN